MPLALTLSLIVGSLGVSTSPTVEPPIPTVEISPVEALQTAVATQVINTASESIESIIGRVSHETGVSSSTLYNLSKSESTLNPDAIGDHGCSYGLTQINICAHKGLTKEEALDPETNLTWAANRIAEGNLSWWTAGNCYSYILTILGRLPHMAQILPNTGIKVGSVAVFNYSGVKHIAYVSSVNTDSFTVKEANYKPGVIGIREVSIDDRSLEGFWSPTA